MRCSVSSVEWCRVDDVKSMCNVSCHALRFSVLGRVFVVVEDDPFRSILVDETRPPERVIGCVYHSLLNMPIPMISSKVILSRCLFFQV